MAKYSALDLSIYLAQHTVKDTVSYFSKHYNQSPKDVKSAIKAVSSYQQFKQTKKTVKREFLEGLRLGKLHHYAKALTSTGTNQATMQKILRSAGVKFTDADLRDYLRQSNYHPNDAQYKPDGTVKHFTPALLDQYPDQIQGGRQVRYRYIITGIWESSDGDIIGIQLGDNYKVDRLEYASDEKLTKQELIKVYKTVRRKEYRHLTTKSGWKLIDVTVRAYVDYNYVLGGQ